MKKAVYRVACAVSYWRTVDVCANSWAEAEELAVLVAKNEATLLGLETPEAEVVTSSNQSCILDRGEGMLSE